jgi:hypothetical protein
MLTGLSGIRGGDAAGERVGEQFGLRLR